MDRVTVNGPGFMAGFQCCNTPLILHRVYLVFILELRSKASPFGLKADHMKLDIPSPRYVTQFTATVTCRHYEFTPVRELRTGLIWCLFDIQGVHFIVPLSTADVTGVWSHRKSAYNGNLFAVHLTLYHRQMWKCCKFLADMCSVSNTDPLLRDTVSGHCVKHRGTFVVVTVSCWDLKCGLLMK
jgi:hypothetical protein